MDRNGVNKIKCSSSHETCVRWCLNILSAVKGFDAFHNFIYTLVIHSVSDYL